ncbi:MAG: hypothetical protein CMI03_10165 [Oceanospirillaceae bacterium]|mgnify:FL=1|uniref:sensor histidine kinase n=1 Tax=unclassified Thalassolituus TaxID=2624967 RepID=UPI000C61A6E2|nr:MULTISPECIES: ATP-binding protein [unclassified Thalassolituus]MAS26040.1 hypothetical protein [Oceanospirillaceae bacterium]MBL34890.1 hypothetical protein [Oceanospirillaceae bacterium]MBS53098.1 hypothetical protein [Oceanospirillaceae bacterium]|tara:strand:- start:193 stop:2118 length:1926 start_codon:yes stop_codon:yes gene_type:complete
MKQLNNTDFGLLFDADSGIRRRARFFSVLIVIVAVLSAVGVCYTLKNRELQQINLQQEIQIFQVSDRINRELGDITRAIRLIKHDNYVQQALNNSQQVKRTLLADRFADFSQGLGNIMQVRWLDNSGMEIVRVDYDYRSGQSSVIAEQGLQDKSQRYYFTQGISVAPGSVYLSDVDLNVEFGTVVKPHQPTVRATLRTTEEDGLHDGLLIINYDLRPLFAAIRQNTGSAADTEILDSQSYWLLHPDPELEWGRDLGNSDRRMNKEAPQLWDQLLAGPVSGLEYKGRLISAHQLILNEMNSAQRALLILMAATSAETLTGVFLQALWPSIILFLLICVVGFYLLIHELHHQKVRLQLMEHIRSEKNELESTCMQLETSLKEQQLLQDELVETRKLSALGMMVAGVAHELNTPIGGAVMMASGLADACRDLKQATETGLTKSRLEFYLRDTEEGLVLLTSNLRQAKARIDGFKRLAIDRFSEEKVEFTFEQVVEDLVASMRQILKDGKATLDITLHSDSGFPMYGYPGVVSQTLQNLIMNSLKHAFAHNGGKISIKAQCHDGVTLRIHFADNGKGVSDSVKETLFDPFVTTGRGNGSSGLGLHLVQQWVTRVLGGSIRISSRQDMEYPGLAFDIEIPLRVPED